jgi:hypothetical protein
MRILASALLTATAVAWGGLPAAAEESPAAVATRAVPSGITVGAELGEPLSLTVGYRLPDPRLGLSLAVGSGVLGGNGLHVHGDITWVPVVLRRGAAVQIPVHVGLGMRYYSHHYEPASIDELPDTHVGVRMSLGVTASMVEKKLEAYGEVAPGYDLRRTESCSLISGVQAICPHTMSSRAFIQGAIGIRYFFGS